MFAPNIIYSMPRRLLIVLMHKNLSCMRHKKALIVVGNIALSQGQPFFFFAGDNRANEHLNLLSMHTLWLREHNRIARPVYITNQQGSISLIFCKVLFTRDILTHNIEIKRYCDKKIFLRHGSL